MSLIGLSAVKTSFKTLATPDTVRVVAKAAHAPHIEYGTAKMGAQPFARPGVSKALAAFDEIEAKSNNLKILVILLAERIAKEWKRLAPVDTGELRDSIEVQK